MEMWVKIFDFPMYSVSDKGRVRNDKSGRILRERKVAKYLGVSLGGKNKYIHRLVAVAFVPNPLSKKEVNHADGNRDNNHSYNLQWVTPSENIQHAIKTGLLTYKSGEESHMYGRKATDEHKKNISEGLKGESIPKPSLRKKVLRTDPDGSKTVYSSASECAKSLGMDTSYVCQLIRGTRIKKSMKYSLEYLT